MQCRAAASCERNSFLTSSPSWFSFGQYAASSMFLRASQSGLRSDVHIPASPVKCFAARTRDSIRGTNRRENIHGRFLFVERFYNFNGSAVGLTNRLRFIVVEFCYSGKRKTVNVSLFNPKYPNSWAVNIIFFKLKLSVLCNLIFLLLS